MLTLSSGVRTETIYATTPPPPPTHTHTHIWWGDRVSHVMTYLDAISVQNNRGVTIKLMYRCIMLVVALQVLS